MKPRKHIVGMVLSVLTLTFGSVQSEAQPFWKRMRPLVPHTAGTHVQANCIASAPGTDRIWVGTETEGIQYSDNFGASWHQSSLNVMSIYHIVPFSAQVLVASTDGAVVRSNDGGQTWLWYPLPSQHSAISMTKTSSGKLLVGMFDWFTLGTSSDSMFVSLDTGRTWQRSSDGITGGGTIADFAQASGGRLYTLINMREPLHTLPEGGLFYSDNEGGLWHQEPLMVQVAPGVVVPFVAEYFTDITVMSNGTRFVSGSGTLNGDFMTLTLRRPDTNFGLWDIIDFGIQAPLGRNYAQTMLATKCGALFGSVISSSGWDGVYISQNNGSTWIPQFSGMAPNSQSIYSVGYLHELPNGRVIAVQHADSMMYISDQPYCMVAGFQQNRAQTTVQVYPNPVLHEVHVVSTNGESLEQLELLDSKGMRIDLSYSKQSQHHATAQVESLPAGVYFLKMSTSSGTSFSRIVKD